MGRLMSTKIAWRFSWTSTLMFAGLVLGCRREVTNLRTQAISIAVDSEPALVITGFSASAEDGFADLRGVRRLTDGSVVCLDGSLGKIGVWDSSGALRWSAGRKGSGPGEFREPQIIGTANADSIFVYDTSLRRLSLWRVGRGLVKEWPAPLGVTGNLQPFGFIDGAIVAKVLRFTMPTPPSRLASSVATVIAWNVERQRVDTLTTLQNGFNNVDGYRYYAWHSVAMATDSSIIFGRGDSTVLHEIDLRGRQMRSYRWEAMPRLVTAAERDAIRRFVAKPGALSTHIDDSDMADTVPQLGRLIRDVAGGVWIPAYEEISTFSEKAIGVFESGAMEVPISLPKNFRLSSVDATSVLGMLETQDGAVVVASFSIHRTVSAAGMPAPRR